MAAQQGLRSTDLRVLEDALGIGLAASGDTVDSLSAEGAYYLEQVTITETSEDDYEYEEIPDDNFSVPEGDEDLIKAVQLVQEKVTDTHILEQKTVLPSKYQVPEVIEDFLCNFLIKMGMTRTLDCFQSEWYEHIQKGITELRAFGNVPDVYTQNMILESENKILKKDLKHFKQAAEKARSELLKTQKERDFHRMHHKRLVQEKNKLVSDLKGLKLHYASYEPTIRVLHEKHQNLLRQKMLTSLEKDRAVGQECRRRPQTWEKSSSMEDTVGKRQQSAQESEFANDVEQSSSLNLSNENVSSKLDFTLNNVFRIHDLPVSWHQD